ncbi:hypothetical protein LTR51_000887 [Lithohypha guttulata]|nr:hypothetical protein LTR51_000887 [Lithohypha guttulata]
MASNPPGSCCYKGVQHEGETIGRFEHMDDVEVYISETSDKSTEHGILIITDVIGHRFKNVQLVADTFAKNGYFVYMPDLFNGNPIPLNRPDDFDFPKWLSNYGTGVEDPIMEKSIKTMREKYGVKRVGAVGYCFGGKYVVRFLKPGQIDVGYSAHPSFVQEDELKGIKGPFAISAAETDHIFPTEKRHRSEEILKEVGQPYQINLYSGVEHGFAVRGDPEKREVQYAKESAFLQALQWFEEHLNIQRRLSLILLIDYSYTLYTSVKPHLMRLPSFPNIIRTLYAFSNTTLRSQPIVKSLGQPLQRATIRSMPTIPFLGSLFSSSTSSSQKMSYPDERTPGDWQAVLNKEQFRVLREKGTEAPFSGEYDKHHPSQGVYTCAGCQAPLYKAEHKFKSGCGWPAYFDAIPGAVTRHTDSSFGMARTEIVCSNCGGHLGHVFKGEGYNTPTDERHCVNSVSLKFNKDDPVTGNGQAK